MTPLFFLVKNAIIAFTKIGNLRFTWKGFIEKKHLSVTFATTDSQLINNKTSVHDSWDKKPFKFKIFDCSCAQSSTLKRHEVVCTWRNMNKVHYYMLIKNIIIFNYKILRGRFCFGIFISRLIEEFFYNGKQKTKSRTEPSLTKCSMPC